MGSRQRRHAQKTKDDAWAHIESNFKTGGYLAEGIEQIRLHYRTVMQGWFAIAEELNGLGQRFYIECSNMLPGRATVDPISLGIQMMPRCLSGFQGSIILAERGLGIEAQSLVRTVMETAFWIGYLSSEPLTAVPRLKRETYKSEIGLFEASLRHLEMSSEIKAEVERQLAEMKGMYVTLPKSPAVEELASLSGYAQSYFFYKELSGAATHLSMKSIHHFLHHEDGEIVGHQIGPDEATVGKAVWIGCRSMILAIDALQRLTDCTHHNDDLKRLHHRVGELEPYGQRFEG